MDMLLFVSVQTKVKFVSVNCCMLKIVQMGEGERVQDCFSGKDFHLQPTMHLLETLYGSYVY